MKIQKEFLMSEINPVNKEIIVSKPIAEAKEKMLSKLLHLKGKVVINDDKYIECDFGSHLKSKLVGELWVKKETLPKKATIKFEEAGNNECRITIDVADTHKFGLKVGFVKKYGESLEELAKSIINEFI